MTIEADHELLARVLDRAYLSLPEDVGPALGVARRLRASHAKAVAACSALAGWDALAARGEATSDEAVRLLDAAVTGARGALAAGEGEVTT